MNYLEILLLALVSAPAFIAIACMILDKNYS